MATFSLTNDVTVENLRKAFNEAFGAHVKLYNGNKVAAPTETLGTLGLSNEGSFECRSSLTVASFIERMKNEFGLNVKVYTCDEWVAVLDGLTLESAGKVKKNAVKADMEDMIAYQRKGNNLQGYEIEAREDGGYTVRKDGVECNNTKAAMREIAALIGLEYDVAWTTRQFGAKLMKAIESTSVSTPAVDNSAAERAAAKAKVEAEAAAKAKAENAARLAAESVNDNVGVDEDFDDDEGFCDNVECNGIEYSCYDGNAEASMFVNDDLEKAESITIPQTIVDNNGNKYRVTGSVITDGVYNEITFPPTLEYIQGETFSDMDEDELFELRHNLAENKNFVVDHRLIYQYNDFDDEKHVYKLVNVQLNRPKGSFIIPEGVGALARSIFINCDELTEIIIPSSMRYVDFEPFEGCDSLERVVVYAPKSQIKCFDDCGEEIAKIEDIIPEGVTLSFVDPQTKERQSASEPIEQNNVSFKKMLEIQKEIMSNAKAEIKKSMLREQLSDKVNKKGCMPIIVLIAFFISIINFLI